MRPSVSLCMIVKDEAPNLARCLLSVAGLFDDVVVVDTGSTDGTPELAARLNARVVPFAWTDSFADARNASLDQARGDWSFWLDADEWLDGDDRRRLLALFSRLGSDDAVYLMRQWSEVGERDAGPIAVSQARLFRRKPGVRWRYRVHEQILEPCLLDGARALLTDVVVRHAGYAAPAEAARKVERNRRLLELERAENPDDPWVLFQAGRIDLEHRYDEAEPLLRRSLASLRPSDALRRQIYALLVKGAFAAGRAGEAAEIAGEALAQYPNDTNLVFQAGSLAFQAGEVDRAGDLFARLLNGQPDADEHLGDLDLSLRGWRMRHNLAVVRRLQERYDEAEALWRAAVAERPDAAQAWLGLAETFLALERWPDLDRALARLDALGTGPVEVDAAEVDLVRARGLLARSAFAEAREVLERVVERRPDETGPRLLLSRALLHEGDDFDAAEQALRDVLGRDPGNAEARHNLAALLACATADADD